MARPTAHPPAGRGLGPPRLGRARLVGGGAGTPFRLRLRLVLARHRRLAVAALLALAVASGLQSLRPAPAPGAPVLVAVRDLPAGHRITASDVALRAWPEGAVPSGLLARPQGRVLAAPVRRGEPVTDVRVTAAGGSAAVELVPATWVAVTVRPTDPAAALVVSPGDHVQVIAGAPLDPLSGSAATPEKGRVVVRDAIVLTAPRPDAPPDDPSGDAGGGVGGGLLGGLSGSGPADRQPTSGPGVPAGILVLGVPPTDALDLAAAGGVRTITVARQIQLPITSSG